ncbi:hypothetical protein FQZ97_1056110 [compost metagenome]
MAQAPRLPTIKAHAAIRQPRRAETRRAPGAVGTWPIHEPSIAVMTLLLLEALGALVLLVFIVWWTMFSGREKGELPDQTRSGPDDDGAPKS